MEIYSDIIIFELLKLNFYLSDSDYLNIKTLENAFYEILDIIEIKKNITVNFNFNKELEKFLDTYEDFVTSNGEEIKLTLDLDSLYEQILKEHHHKLSSINYDISDYCLKPKICLTLGVSIPFQNSVEYIALNSSILRKYLRLGEKELQNTPSTDEDITSLNNSINDLKEIIKNADEVTLTKLRICFNCFNEQFLSSKNERFINSPWNTILFSYNYKRFCSLRYDRAEYLISMLDEESDENVAYEDSEEPETNANPLASLDELPLFLTCFLIYLNNYLKTHPTSPAREALIIKKYLLLSTPELVNIENYFLEHHTIDDLTMPPVNEDNFTETTFEELKEKVISCTINLNIDDTQAINHPHLYATLVTCALFIKTYITLSINENSKSDIIDLITNSIFYKQANYKIATSIVDNIIFSDNLNLTK